MEHEMVREGQLTKMTDEERAEALAEERTGAEFRAMRETIGWTQREVGVALGYGDEQPVKRWENPKAGWIIRPFAWAWMDRQVAQHAADVDALIDRAHEWIDRQPGRVAGPVLLAYWRNGIPTDGRPAGALNAIAREVGQFLESEGYGVRYVWANDEPDALR